MTKRLVTLGAQVREVIETAVLASWVEVDFSAKLSQMVKWHRNGGWAGPSGLHLNPDLAVVPMTHQSYFSGLNFFDLENGRGKGDSPESLLLQGELLAGAEGLLAEPKAKPSF